jgi:hypothetical protein
MKASRFVAPIHLQRYYTLMGWVETTIQEQNHANQIRLNIRSGAGHGGL